MEPFKTKSLREEVGYRRGFSQAISYALHALGAGEHIYIDDVLRWRLSDKEFQVFPPEMDDDDIQQIRELIADRLKDD
jgi:hypothetical protein